MCRQEHNLLSAGDCPICSSSGVLVLLASVGDDSLLFVCPECGVAWTSPPAEHTVDEIVAIEDAAPKGLRFPSTAEVEAVRGGGIPLRHVSVLDWADDLAQYLAGR